MALPSAVASSGRGVRVKAEIDARQPVDQMQRLWRVLSGPSLESYLKNHVHPHFQNEIVQRFAYEGDRASGNWPALSDATQQIRSSLGFSPDDINMRTGELFQTVTEEADFRSGSNMAEMVLPGSAGAKGTVAEKIRTAQQGKPPPNPMSPSMGATPPRPVLAADESDLAFVLTSLNRWIIWQMVGGMR